MTRRIVEAAGVSVPEQVEADDREAVQALLERGGSLVVKPARGEQGRGVAVDLDTLESVETAITNASAHSDRVIVESFYNGDELRLIGIVYKLVASVIRRTAEVRGIGRVSATEIGRTLGRERVSHTALFSLVVLN